MYIKKVKMWVHKESELTRSLVCLHLMPVKEEWAPVFLGS